MNETLEIIQSEFAQASFETFEMVLISMIAAAILGTILGLVLHLASNPIFYKNRVVNGITGTIINVIRSLPFIMKQRLQQEQVCLLLFVRFYL